MDANAQDAEPVAAVDLGSNSFHMVIARQQGDGLTQLDRHREPVRLAAGLDAKKRLAEEAGERALECLSRMGQRLAGIPSQRVRVVGTNTLRQAKKAGRFLAQATEALGHPIEILRGPEEARLIYLGVSHDQPLVAGRRLVVDIGGGSTEVILGERFDALETDSLHMGCVSFSRRYFPEDVVEEKAFKKAVIKARLELETVEQRLRESGWEECIGSSGTITAIEEIVRAAGWSESGITLSSLKKLKKALLRAGHSSDLRLEGLTSERAPVLPGGLAILIATFESLGIRRMSTSSAALREGILWDLLGRIRHEDVRDRTIRDFAQRFHVDVEQARRVERTSLGLLNQVAKAWDIERVGARRFIAWAGRLHEIGLSVSYAGYHRHGEYLLQHSVMSGFSREDQILLARLVRSHRRRLDPAVFDELPPSLGDLGVRLAVLLRLAVRLNRGRSRASLPAFRLAASEESPEMSGLELVFPEGWLDEHPLTSADLEEETAMLSREGWALVAR